MTLRNSKFDSNAADGNNAGVVSMGEYTTLVVAGVENLFQNNTCGGDGAVFGGTTSTNITVEGGVFEGNFADGVGGWVDRAMFVKKTLFFWHDLMMLRTFCLLNPILYLV